MENNNHSVEDDLEGLDKGDVQDWDVVFRFLDYFRLEGYKEGHNYCRRFELVVSTLGDNVVVAIAQGEYIQYELAAAHGFPFEEVGSWCDIDSSILPRSFFEHLGANPWPLLDAHYHKRPHLNRNILVVDRLDILPKYRRRGIGRFMLQYMAELLYMTCGLMVVQVLPSQHRVHNRFAMPDKDWEDALELDKLEQDHETARYRLMGRAIKMGFENPFGIDHVFAPMDTMALDWKHDLSRLDVPTDYDDDPEEWDSVFEDEHGNRYLIIDDSLDTDDDDESEEYNDPDVGPEEQP